MREIVAASYFGVKGPMSAFTIAFQVPNLIRSLFADAALQAAFVPVFTEQLEKRSRVEAFRVASALLFVIAVALGAITALFVLLAPVVMPLFAPGFDDELTDLTVDLSRLLFPIVLLLGLSGLVVGVLNSFEHFAVPAIAPLFWNLVIIVTLVVLTPQFEGNDRIYAYAIGVLLGTSCSSCCRCHGCGGRGSALARDFDWRDERVMRVLKLMFPVTLGLGLINFNLSVDSIFATLISEGTGGDRQGVPHLHAAPGSVRRRARDGPLPDPLPLRRARRQHGAAAVLASGMRQLLLLLVPATAAILVLSEPITQILYQRGEFDASQTDLVAEALFYFSLCASHSPG